jgi:hypothetical protein
VDDFLSQERIRGHTSTTERYLKNDYVPDGWNPDAVAHFVSADIGYAPAVGGLCYLLVDLDHAERPVVYVYWQGP